MAQACKSVGAVESEKSGSVQRGRKLGLSDCLFVTLGLCAILGTVGLGWRNSKFEEIWRLWQEEKLEYGFGISSSEWESHVVNITLVTKAVESGAVCLDGSPPAYFLDRGSGEDADNWLLFHEGGNWCTSTDDCIERSYTELGSSKYMPLSDQFEGMLSSSPVANPDFHTWNRVVLKYCDGASFSGEVSDPVEVVSNSGPFVDRKAPVVFMRGQRIWGALMDELMEVGMKNARKAFYTGCSAGGQAVILHCDRYRDLMPKTTLVKCLSDAGFFIDIPSVSGAEVVESRYADVVQLHNVVGSLPEYCTSGTAGPRCFFPENDIAGLQTPMFILNPAYDVLQIKTNLLPLEGLNSVWLECRRNLSVCSDVQMAVVHSFRDRFVEKLQPLLQRERDGAFINSCYMHCQSFHGEYWNNPGSPRIDNKTISTVVGDWYFERNTTKLIDGKYPCNPTCSDEYY